MATTDQTILDLARRISELERKVRASETSARLERSAVVVDPEAGASLDVKTALLDSSSASANLAAALLATVAASDVTDGRLTVYFTATQPETPSPGDVWLREGDQLLMSWDGLAWAVYLDQTWAAAFAGSFGALSTADGLIETFWQLTPPELGAVGDLWFNTGNANAPYRWDSAAWVAVGTTDAASVTYQPGVAGWALRSDGTSQFEDVAVLGQLGAAIIDAGAVKVAGEDLGGLLAAGPQGIKAWAGKGVGGATAAGDTSGTTEKLLFDFAPGDVVFGRLYRVTISGFLQGTVDTDRYQFRVRYTLDNTAPVAPGSAIMDGSFVRMIADQSFSFTFYYPPSSSNPLRMALTVTRITGTGVARILTNDPNRRFEWTLEDIGPAVNNSAQLAQVAKTDGSASDPVPNTTYTKTWAATWAQAYYSSGVWYDTYGPPTYSTSLNNLFQGWNPEGDPAASIPAGFTSARSLIGFNYTDIVAKLAGASAILEAYLTFTCRGRRTTSGLDVHILRHTYTAKPADFALTFPDANVTEDIASRNDCAPGATYKVPLGGDLGAAVGAMFAAGTCRGLGFAASSSSSAQDGYMYGLLGGHPPVLTIVYRA